jgi:hypothetical protein
MLSPAIINGVQTLDMDQLRELQTLLNARWNLLRKQKAAAASASFSKGMSVQFKDKTGMVIEGTVLKINRTSISVTTEFGRWNVHPNLLIPAGKDLLGGK